MNEIKKRNKGQLILAIVFIVLPFLAMDLIGEYFLDFIASLIGSDGLRYFVIVGFIVGFAIGFLGVFMLVNYFRKKSDARWRERKLYRLALGFEIACPLSLLLAFTLVWFPLGQYFALFLLLFGILSPFIGLVVGIQALAEAIHDREATHAALALLAILLPIIVVGTTIVMFSTGVWVIRFM